MSIDKDSKDEKGVSPVARPPAVAERVWALIPDALRGDYVRSAALGLRRGIHPETAITDRLEADGICSYEDIETALRAAADLAEDRAMADLPQQRAEDVPRSIEKAEGVAAVRAVREPVWPFGNAGYRRGDVPRGEIGSILHYDKGFDGPASSEIEWLVLSAISRDPSFVLKDPSNLRLLGCDLPADVLSAVRSSVIFECECVIADVRRRQAAGDPSSLSWIDPESLNL